MEDKSLQKQIKEAKDNCEYNSGVFDELTTRIEDLEEENKKLQKDIDDLTDENKELKERIQ